MKYRVPESMFTSQVDINNVDINDHYSSLVCYDVETYSPRRDSRTRISKSRLTLADVYRIRFTFTTGRA